MKKYNLSKIKINYCNINAYILYIFPGTNELKSAQQIQLHKQEKQIDKNANFIDLNVQVQNYRFQK